MQAQPHYSRNPETKQREPDGVWEFDPGSAMRALHELAEHIRGLETGTEREEGADFETWLAEQNKQSGL